MIELLLGGITPPNNPLIETVKEPIAIVETAPELTLEEKIAHNYYKCDETIQYIRADDATCLDKPVYTPTQTQNTARGSVNAPQGWYPYGQCTYYVATQRAVGQWNNASSWLRQAQADGWATGSTPVVGAIAWESNHVSLVVAVNGDSVTVREMNYKGFGVVSTRTAPATQFKYIY